MRDLYESGLQLKKTSKYLPDGVGYNFYKQQHNSVIYYNKGMNSTLWDIDGNDYIDLYGKSGSMILGHNNREFNEKLTEQINSVLSVNDTTLIYDACELLNECFPSCEMFRFGLSGTEVIQNAFRLSRAYTQKQKIVRFWGHFHGNADNVLGDEYDPETYEHIDKYKTHLSTEGRSITALEESYIMPWNNKELFEKFIKINFRDIAAVIMEPIMINNGGLLPNVDFLQKVRELCTKYNIILIFDEVISGVRVSLGGAQKLFGVDPDITILGKAISNGGVPVSAFGGRKDILSYFSTKKVVQLGTYNAYPLGMAAIKATLSILIKDKAAYIRMAYYAEKIRKIMEDTAAELNIPLTFQGHLLSQCFHSNSNDILEYQPLRRDNIYKTILRNAFLKHGIIIAPPSRIYMNTSFDEKDLLILKQRVESALQSVAVIMGRS